MSRVCPTTGCPNLKPCPTHPPRNHNAHWSKTRDRAKQAAFRNAVLARDNHTCVKCNSTTDLIAHHDRPGYTPDCGRTLCRACHRDVDQHAR